MLIRINNINFDNNKQLFKSDRYVLEDLEEIKTKNKEIEVKLETIKLNIEHKAQQFETVKQQIDKDFEVHVN